MRKIMITAVPKDEQRSVIEFLTLENVSSIEIYTRMWVVDDGGAYGNSRMPN